MVRQTLHACLTSKSHLLGGAIPAKMASNIPTMYLKGFVLRMATKIAGRIKNWWMRQPLTDVMTK